ncbi:MAG: hypothetical protein V1493_04555 [Candidatus Diapherotrites archaeon]
MPVFKGNQGSPLTSNWRWEVSGATHTSRSQVWLANPVAPFTGYLNHELLHSIEVLLRPVNFNQKTRWWGPKEKMTGTKIAVQEWLKKELTLREAKKSNRFSEKITKRAHNYMDFLGPDYAILLFAGPPKRTNIPSILLWQAKMKKAGFIENGRLTQKGLSVLRGQIQR